MTGSRTPAPRDRGIDSQRETAANCKREAKRLRVLEDAVLALRDPDVAAYVSVLGAAHAVAIDGVSRGQGGAYQMGTGHPAVQALFRAEARHLAGRRRTLLGKLDAIVGEAATYEQIDGDNSQEFIDTVNREEGFVPGMSFVRRFNNTGSRGRKNKPPSAEAA
jgi:hypothetical protein